MLFIVDTSFLIVLKQLDWLDELSHPDDIVLCPAGVVQELNKNKKLLNWLNKGVVAITKVEKPRAMTKISETDAEVISLALEKGGSILSEDTELRKKAENLGISAFNMAGFFALNYQHGRFGQDDCLARLRILVDKKLLSQITYRQILRSIKA